MKVTKEFLLTLFTAGSLITCGSAIAQDSTNAPSPTPAPAAPHMMRGPNMEGLMRALNLTEAQKAQVQPILADASQKMRDLHNDASLSPEDRRAKMKEIRDETSAQLKPILTPKQFEKLQSRMSPHHPRPQAPNVSTNAAPQAP